MGGRGGYLYRVVQRSNCFNNEFTATACGCAGASFFNTRRWHALKFKANLLPLRKVRCGRKHPQDPTPPSRLDLKTMATQGCCMMAIEIRKAERVKSAVMLLRLTPKHTVVLWCPAQRERCSRPIFFFFGLMSIAAKAASSGAGHFMGSHILRPCVVLFLAVCVVKVIFLLCIILICPATALPCAFVEEERAPASSNTPTTARVALVSVGKRPFHFSPPKTFRGYNLIPDGQ